MVVTEEMVVMMTTPIGIGIVVIIAIVIVVIAIVIVIVIAVPATADLLQLHSCQLCSQLWNLQGANTIKTHVTVPFFQA